MSIQTINLGNPDKGNGDPIRTAFSKINGNFSEIQSILSGFDLTNSIPSLSGNNGKYLTNDGSTLEWATLNVPTDISQLTDSTNLLNSSSAVVEVGEDPPVDTTQGKLWYDTESGRTYVRYDNSWVDANPKAANINLASVTQSIIPSLDSTYDLGSPEKQWRSLYVSTSTIYINGIPLSIDEGGNLTVDGDPVGGGIGPEGINAIENGDSNVTIATPQGNITVNADGAVYTFGTNGTLTFPNGTVQTTAYDGENLEIDGGNASTDYTAEILIDGGGA